MDYKIVIRHDVVDILYSFLGSYIRSAGKKGAVVGLSGGIDSAVVGIIAKNALGKDHVLFLIMPDENSSQKDIDDALSIAGDAPYKKIGIEGTVGYFLNVLNIPKEGNEKLIGNIKARVRMITLYHYAAINDYLVVGTGNKSEILTGYFTKYGDGGSDLLPIGDLYKTEIFELARMLNINEEIIRKPPSAGLWYGQKDEDELGITYELLDKILYGIEHLQSDDKITSDLRIDPAIVKKVEDMVRSSWHKRNMATVLKLGFRTVGVDWYD